MNSVVIGRINLIVYRSICAHVIRCLLCASCAFFLLASSMAFLNPSSSIGKSLLLQDLLRQIEREAIRIIKLECVLSGQRLLPPAVCISSSISLRMAKTLIDGLVKLLLFLA